MMYYHIGDSQFFTLSPLAVRIYQGPVTSVGPHKQHHDCHNNSWTPKQDTWFLWKTNLQEGLINQLDIFFNPWGHKLPRFFPFQNTGDPFLQNTGDNEPKILEDQSYSTAKLSPSRGSQDLWLGWWGWGQGLSWAMNQTTGLFKGMWGILLSRYIL